MTHIWQNPDWPRFTYDAALIEPLLLQFAESIGEVRGLHSGLTATEREEIILREITREAVHSFGIEGVSLNPTEVQDSVIASMKHRNLTGATRRSDDVAEMMLEARDPAITLDAKRLHHWHCLLFQRTEIEEMGRWRSFEMEIVKSANAGDQEVLYTAVPPDRVADEMTTFFAGIGQAGLPTPVRAAIAHLWFESIHPYSDGNGRIGRAIVEHIFAKTAALPFSLSRQIEADKKAYYQALQNGRRAGQGGIDATAFVEWFLTALLKAVQVSGEEARFLMARNRFFMDHGTKLSARQEKVLRRLFSEGETRVKLGISASSYGRISGVSAATATRDLGAMAAQGILRRSETGGRSTVYYLEG